MLELYGLLMLLSLIGGLAFHFATGPWLDVLVSAVWIGITLRYLRTEWKGVAPAFRVGRQSKRAGPMIAAAVLTVVFLEAYFAAFKFMGFSTLRVSRLYLDAGWPVWSVFAMVSLEPGFIEEVAFRGIIQTRLSKIVTRNEALVIQAALFSILHLSPAIFVSHFVMGLFLGWVRQRCGHVYYGMALHMGWNAWVVVQELRHLPA